MFRVFISSVLFAVLAVSAVYAESEQMQRSAQSWMGLTGLYVIPTARVMEKNELALTFSEAKHVEYVPTMNIAQRYMDRQISQSATVGVADNFEIYFRRNRNIYDQGNKARMENTTFYDYGFKWQVSPENLEKGTPAVAIAVRDLEDNRDLGSIPSVKNGRNAFLLATKRIGVNQDSGNFADLTLGVGKNYKASSFLFGMECSVSPTVSIIAEGLSNSPFINFHQYTAKGDVAGRFVYNTGMRIYPDALPGMVVDLGFVGDGAFEFSFGWGYVKKF